MSRCTAADYEAAASAICLAMEADAQMHKRHKSSGYKALLDVRDFHACCLELARSIARDRWYADDTQRRHVQQVMAGTTSGSGS